MGSHNNAMDLRESFRGPDLNLFFRDLRDRQARKRHFTVKSWSTIKDVKDAISSVLNVPPGAIKLYYGPLTALPNHRSLHDAGIYRSGETLLLDIQSGQSGLSSLQRSFDICVCTSMLEATPRHLRHVVQQARRGLAIGLKPELVMDGSGGTYYLHDARKVRIAVFKPADEEPFAANNPRGYVPQSNHAAYSSLREGIDPGEACLREVAAYLLDHGGFSGVPMTTLTEARHPAFHTNDVHLNGSQGRATVGSHALMSDKQSRMEQKKVGSFQSFVNAECTMDDMSPSKLSKDEVQKIAILDIRLMNADRNAANLLCQRQPDNSLKLIPIDHGFCLRSVCDVSWMDWCWLDWPQLKQPLSKRMKDYVLNLDIDADARLLKETLNIQGTAIDYFRASSKMLQDGVKAGLTLYQIATMCCRNDDMGEVPSPLEIMSDIAKELSSMTSENGRWHHTAASRAIAEQLSPSADGDSLLSASRTRFFKSASTLNFSSLSHTDSNDVPGMAQSSASDASSDVGDAALDREECEEWAASVIADVSTDKRLRVSAEDDASGVEEEGMLSSSPKGFWVTKPSEQVFDDHSITWSPASSPMSSMELPKDVGLGMPDIMTASIKLQKRVFADADFLLPPATIDVSSVKSPEKVSGALMFRRSSSGMSRSQSYSSFRSRMVPQSVKGLTEPAEAQCRPYFHKFLDLIIAREITAAVQAS